MKLKSLLLVLTVAALGITLLACGGAEEPETQMPATEAQEQMAEPAQTAEAYPIDYCVVSGEKLGSMGDPVTRTYQGRTVKFCCEGCISTFEKSPEMYIAKLDSAKAGLLEHPHEHEGMEGHEGHSHGG